MVWRIIHMQPVLMALILLGTLSVSSREAFSDGAKPASAPSVSAPAAATKPATMPSCEIGASVPGRAGTSTTGPTTKNNGNGFGLEFALTGFVAGVLVAAALSLWRARRVRMGVPRQTVPTTYLAPREGLRLAAAVGAMEDGRKALQLQPPVTPEGMATQCLTDLADRSLATESGRVEAARGAAKFALERLLSTEFITPLNNGLPLSSERRERLQREFERIVPEFVVPAPVMQIELDPAKLAVAAGLGAIFGSILLVSIAVFATEYLRTCVAFAGAILGPAALVWAVAKAGESDRWRKVLTFIAGAALMEEILGWIFDIGPLGWPKVLWGKLAGRSGVSRIRRIAICLGAVLLLWCILPRRRYNREAYRQALEANASVWLTTAVMLLAATLREPKPLTCESDATLAGMGRCLNEIYRASPDLVETRVKELLVEARNYGFEGLSGPSWIDGSAVLRNRFIWDESWQDRFTTYGHISLGDMVEVEQDPVIQAGKVLQHGVVRKVRERI